MKKVLSVISRLSDLQNSSVVSFVIVTQFHLEVKAFSFGPSYLEHVLQIDEFSRVQNDNGFCVLHFYFDDED